MARTVGDRLQQGRGIWSLGWTGLAALAVAVALVPVSSAQAGGGPISACTFAALKSAAEAGGSWSLSACTNIEFGGQTITVPAGVSVTFEGADSVSLLRGAPFFIVPDTASLALVEMTLKGGFVHGTNGVKGNAGTNGTEGNHGTEGTEGTDGKNNESGDAGPGEEGTTGLPGTDATAGTAGTAGTTGGEAKGGAVQVDAGGTLTVRAVKFYEDEAHGGEGGEGGHGGQGQFGGFGALGGQGGVGGQVFCFEHCPDPAGAQGGAGGIGAAGSEGGSGSAGTSGGAGGVGGGARGGAIYNEGTLNVSGGTEFFEDYAYGGFGGAGGAGGAAGAGGGGGNGGRGGESGCNDQSGLVPSQYTNCGEPGAGGAGGAGGGGGAAGAGGQGAAGGDAEGGAIYNAGTATVAEASFELNTAKAGDGNGQGNGGYGGGGGSGGTGGKGGENEMFTVKAPDGAPGAAAPGQAGGTPGLSGTGGVARGGAIANAGTLSLIEARTEVNLAEGGKGAEGALGGHGGAGGSSATGGDGANGAAGGDGGAAMGGLLFSTTTATVSFASESGDKSVAGKGGAGGGGGGEGGQDVPNGSPGTKGAAGVAGLIGQAVDPEIDGDTVAPGATPVEKVAPSISGTATEGETLSGSTGEWEGEPTSYEYSWERCEANGEGCSAVGGADGPEYKLIGADVGHEIELQVTARNANGPGIPATSLPTSLVTAASSGRGSPGGGSGSTGSTGSTGSGSTGSTGGGSTGSTGSTGSGSGSSSSGAGTPKATISSAQIIAVLMGELQPTGKGAKIHALLKAGLLTASVGSLEAGTLSVSWYYLPPGARLSRHAAPKPVLIASGRAGFSGAVKASIKIKLTGAGKRLLAHAKQLKVTAKASFSPTAGTAVSTTRTFLLKG